MSQSIDRVIDLSIDLATSNAQAENMKLPIIVGEAAEFPSSFTDSERIRFYFDLPSVFAGGFASTSNVYKLAQAAFSQGAITQLGIAKKVTADANYTDALNGIADVNNDWYGLAITSRVDADILAASAFCEANNKLGSFASQEASILDNTSTTDIMSVMKANSYKNSFITYHSQANTVFIDGAALAGLIGSDAGQYTLAYKTLTNIPVDNIKANNINTIEGKKGNYYTTLAKTNRYFWGTTPFGNSIALTRDLFWFKRQVQLGELNAFFNNGVIRFNAQGIAIIETQIITAADVAEKQNILRSATIDEIASALGITIDKVIGYRPAFGYALQMPNTSNDGIYDQATKTLSGIILTAKIADEIHMLSLKFKLSI